MATKLTDEQIKNYSDPYGLDIPFENPDGDDYSAIFLSSRYCNNEFWSEFVKLKGWDIEGNYELDYDELCAKMEKAAKDGEASDIDILLYDYLASGKAWDDKNG